MSLCLGRTPAMHGLILTPTVEMSLGGERAENESRRPEFATMSALEVGVTQQARTHS